MTASDFRHPCRACGDTGWCVHRKATHYSCHPRCALGEADHPGSREYRCIDAAGESLPFPDEASA